MQTYIYISAMLPICVVALDILISLYGSSFHSNKSEVWLTPITILVIFNSLFAGIIGLVWGQ